MTTVVPQTFYLTGGAAQSATPPSSHKAPLGSSTGGEKSESNGSGCGRDDRAKFLAYCAEMDGLSGACCSPSPSSPVGLLEPPITVATSPAEPELATASNDHVGARGPLLLSPTTPEPTATGEDVEAAAVEGVTSRSCSPETDEPSARDSLRNSSPTAKEEAVPPRKSLTENGFSPQGAAESCPPDTVLRSASLPPPPLSPSSSPCGRCPPGGSPETLVEESSPTRRGEATVPNSSVLVRVDTDLLPPGGDRGTKTCACSERREKAREGEAALRGPVSGGGTEGAAQMNVATASRSSISPPKEIVKSSQDNGEPGPTAVAEARRTDTSGGIASETTERNWSTSSVDIKPGGAAGGMPTWVVKPAANTNCGFGIQVCCSLKVTDCSHPFAVERQAPLSRSKRSITSTTRPSRTAQL